MRKEIKFKAIYDNREWTVETRKAKRNNNKGYHKSQGYICRLVTEHPFADGRGYIREHRLVMEQHLGRFLKADEIIHHKDGNRENNELSNLEVYTDQKRHAASHAAIYERDAKSQRWIPDAALAGKKFRLFNRNSGLMEIWDLSRLINTTFRKGQFEYRGEWTGLLDKNGKEIYEGDILRAEKYLEYYLFPYEKFEVEWSNYGGWWPFVSAEDNAPFPKPGECEIIGNIHEHPGLLSGKQGERV